MAETRILAIDQSTSGTKAILFDVQGKVVHRCTESHEQFYPRPAWVEHDPEEIWEKTKLAIRNVLSQSKTRTSDIAAVAVTNQRETVAAWDRRSGKPEYNAVVWQCQRGAEACRALKDRGLDDVVKARNAAVAAQGPAQIGAAEGALLARWEQKAGVLYAATGCRDCGGSGYAGRLGLFEVLEMDGGLEELATRGVRESELRERALAGGLRPLIADGLAKAVAGLTTLEEVERSVAF